MSDQIDIFQRNKYSILNVKLLRAPQHFRACESRLASGAGMATWSLAMPHRVRFELDHSLTYRREFE